MEGYAVVAESTRSKAVDAIELLSASLAAYQPFDPAKNYSPAEREPYDAMCDRYVRAVEAAIKFFPKLRALSLRRSL
ncbi:MAG: hypothetical protein ACRED0_01605 [Gammaproteobacteria bacterium]